MKVHFERTKNKFNDLRSRNSVFFQFYIFFTIRTEVNYQVWQQYITNWHLIHIDVAKLRRTENIISKLKKILWKFKTSGIYFDLTFLNKPWKQMFMEFLSNISIKNSEANFFSTKLFTIRKLLEKCLKTVQDNNSKLCRV